MEPAAEYQHFERLVQKLVPQGWLRRTWSLTGGISAAMTAMEIEAADGQTMKVIVRQPGALVLHQNSHTARDEFNLLQMLSSAGLAAPRPILLDDSGEVFSTPTLVMAYIEGQPEFAPADLPDFTRQMAVQLAAIHRTDCADRVAARLPPWPQGLVEDFGAYPAAPNPSFEEGCIRVTLQSAWPLKPRNPPALLHGDFWPGNLLWRDGRLEAVIDWEDAAFGDPLADLAISRLEMLWIFGLEAMQSFTRQYRKLMALDFTDLPYWDLCAALRLARLAGPDLVGWAAFFQPYGRMDITPETIREHYRYFVRQAYDKLSGIGYNGIA